MVHVPLEKPALIETENRQISPANNRRAQAMWIVL
jgi:hypothetical protein